MGRVHSPSMSILGPLSEVIDTDLLRGRENEANLLVAFVLLAHKLALLENKFTHCSLLEVNLTGEGLTLMQSRHLLCETRAQR